MSSTNNDFEVIKGKGLHNFSIRPANGVSSSKQEDKTSKHKDLKKPE